MRKWLIVALTIAWLGWEMVAVLDSNPSTWPLTQIVVTYVPAYITLPAALILAVWLPWHFITEYRRKRRR
jgi:hypothetical protein